MIDNRARLTFKFDDTNVAVITDYTQEAADFLRDTMTIEMTPSLQDYLYIGYYKPFAAIYVSMSVPQTKTTLTLNYEYYNGTAWTALSALDHTKEFQRDGYMSWSSPTDWASTTYDGDDKFWIRIQPTQSTTQMGFNGINLIFADDHDLKNEFYEIDNANLIPAGQTTHLSTHVASRNFIVQKLRNEGFIKTDANNLHENITQWDLMDIFEVRQAAVFLALSKIFFNLSDSQDDNWWQKYKEYQDKFEESMRLVKLTVDYDDDGIVDNGEKAAPITVARWNR